MFKLRRIPFSRSLLWHCHHTLWPTWAPSFGSLATVLDFSQSFSCPHTVVTGVTFGAKQEEIKRKEGEILVGTLDHWDSPPGYLRCQASLRSCPCVVNFRLLGCRGPFFQSYGWKDGISLGVSAACGATAIVLRIKAVREKRKQSGRNSHPPATPASPSSFVSLPGPPTSVYFSEFLGYSFCSLSCFFFSFSFSFFVMIRKIGFSGLTLSCL